MIVDGYVRVSQVAGRTGERFISPSDQREQIERWAEHHGALLARVYEELDESGGRPDRALLEEAIQRVEAGESNGIVVAYMSRFGRSTLDGLLAIKRITDGGGSFVSVQEAGLDYGSDTGRFVLRHMLSIAEWDLDRTRAGWREANRRAIVRGVLPCAPPYGYRRGPDGRLHVEPAHAKVVRELFRLRTVGARCSDLQLFLEFAGVRSPTGLAVWPRATIRKLIMSRVYRGEARYGSFVNESAHQPIVSEETWLAAQSGHPVEAVA